MRYYFAPMEGITGHLYRKAHRDIFGAADKYFTPFLVPHTSRNFNSREKNDILPEHNEGSYLVPQILTNRAEDFIRLSKALSEYGYEEVNLNLGCPSKTVVSKGKGAGFLADPEAVDHFLEEVFSALSIKVSVKTRIGVEDAKEFPKLLEIYNKYPLEELIIHPRLQTDYYKNHPNLEVFAQSVVDSKNPVCYNGDLFTKTDYESFRERFPQTERVMFGRGLITNPALIRTLREGKPLFKEELMQFHDRILSDYEAMKIGDRNVLFKMKELWFYMITLFSDYKKAHKRIKKAQNLSVYREAVERLCAECELR
ncbi:MAG: tRNA-dihydrouridine synthase family protein [Lachnospiraceae bacterium]|nr:tRNA-dihydrouridine synthase family protein [Lachnospiraceae bacterium]